MGNQARQWLAALACTINVAMTAVGFGWMVPLMVQFTSADSPVPMTTTDTSWLSAFPEIAETLSTIMAALFADRWGRKTAMMLACPLAFASWILIIMTRSIPALYVARYLHGLNMAISFTSGPIYLAEVAESNIRGKLTGQFQTLWYGGSLYAFVAGAYLSYDNYGYVCAALPVLSFILLLAVPESPYYLLMVKKEQSAKEAFTWLRGGEDVTKEFERAKECVQNEMSGKGGWKDLFATKKDRIGFAIVIVVCLIKYLNGICAVNTYVLDIFKRELGFSLSSRELTVMFFVVLTVATFFTSLIIDKVGRKPLFVISCGGSALFTLVVAIIFFLDKNTDVDVEQYKWMSYVSLISFDVICSVGLAPLTQTIQAEYFPTNTRGIGGGITAMIGAIACCINIRLYQVIIDYIGIYMNYVLFFVISFVGTIFFVIVIPETSGQTLGEIQDTFEKKVQK